MKFTAVISVEGDVENILKLFKKESKKFKHKRSSYDLVPNNERVDFNVEAEDATALRSTMDSIAKILKIYEDVKDVK